MVTGKQRRLGRLLGEDGRTILVALDHSVTTGASGGLSDMNSVMHAVIRAGVDGIVVHRGSAGREMPVQRGSALIIHMSGNTTLSEHPELKTRVCDPATACALGADAVSAHVTLGVGHAEDRRALTDLGQVADACDRLGMPLLVMTYVTATGDDRGRAVLHAARVASELGADIVKTAHPGDEYLSDLAASLPVPVVIAGGGPTGSWTEYLEGAKNAMGAGVAGLCVGRWVFGSPSPEEAATDLVRVVHGTS